MNLITDDWRLKLIAAGLALLMLGAVAFSQNPLKQVVLKDVSIGYTVAPDIVVIDPPLKASVTVTGLADALTTVNSRNVAASFDLAKVSPGQNVHVNLNVHSLLTGVKVQDSIVPYVLNIDKLEAFSIPIDVHTPRVTPGWSPSKREALCPNPGCKVIFTGPATWGANLTAYADFPVPVQQDLQVYPSVPVQLLQNGQPFNLNRLTQPQLTIEPLSVQIVVEARPGTSSRQVVLIDASPTRGPSPCCRITKITVEPVSVVISGTPEALAGFTSPTLELPAVDLNGATSDRTIQVTIRYPPGITGSAQVARVTYSISPNPSLSPPPGA